MVWAAVKESPWEDEFHSLLPEPLRRYRAYPAYFTWLVLGRQFTEDFLLLRLWSALPWIVGLPLAHALYRRIGASWNGATVALFCVALNPYLISEAANIRYYGFSLLASVLAIHGGLTWARPDRARIAGAFAIAALFLPALTITSGGILSLLILAWVVWRHRAEGRRHWWLPAAVLAPVFLAIAAFHFRPLIRRILDQGLDGVRGGFPIMTGYGKAPVDASTYAWQYEKLQGWHVLEGLLPSVVLEVGALALALAGLVALARTRSLRARPLLCAMLLVPVLVCMLASVVVNFINPRYYLFVSLALAAGHGRLIEITWARPRLRLVAILLLVIPPLIAARGALMTHLPPMDAIIEELRARGVTQVVVDPAWYRSHLAQHFSYAGLRTRVLTADLYRGPLPEWVFVKDPRYTWRRDGRPPPRRLSFEDAYVPVARAVYPKRYYFHDVRMVDRLLRRSPDALSAPQGK
jgi:hypothetical protein